MKISIALATYNGGEYLQEQLDSFLKQNVQPDELVISDDGSVDNTIEIIQRFQKHAPFDVVLIKNNENCGYACNFSRALSATTGTIVFLSDQDDVWFENKISFMLFVADKHPESQVIMCDAALTDEELNNVGYTKLGQIRASGLPDSSFVMGCCVAVRKEFLELILPIPKTYPSHDDWIVRMADGVGAKYIAEEVLQYYRRHGGNQSKFIANSLSRVTRTKIIKHRLTALVRATKGVGAANYYQQVQQFKLFTNGIEDASRRCADNCGRWLQFVEGTKATLRNMESKAGLYKYSRLRRMPVVIKKWLRGHYSHANETSSVIRDLLAPKLK